MKINAMFITVHKCTVREKTGISEVRCDTLEIITWKFIKVYNRDTSEMQIIGL